VLSLPELQPGSGPRPQPPPADATVAAAAVAPTPLPPTPTPVAVVEARGTLVVQIDPGGMATLGGWHVPDGGQRVSKKHSFTGVEPRTYELKAFRDGFLAETRNVTVRSGETVTLKLKLRKM